MGKGGGCVPSKKKPPQVLPDESPIVPDTNTDASTVPILSTEATPVAKLKVLIVFYSMYGHVEGLARRMKKGVDGVDGVEGVLFRVPETLSDEVLEQIRAPSKNDDHPGP